MKIFRLQTFCYFEAKVKSMIVISIIMCLSSVCHLTAKEFNIFRYKMLPKNVDWSILAQCDYFAVENLIQTSDRPARQTVRIQPMRKSLFQRKLSLDIKWKNTFEAISTAYINLSPMFQIKHDSFGGYRMVYCGSKTIYPTTVFKRSPIGFVTAVPDGVVTDLSVMSSERTGEQLLLLGPMRFVNSDCRPNCEYDFSSDSGVVQLRVLRRVNPSNELFVRYGPEFFEANECRCRTCGFRKIENEKNETAFELILHDLIAELVDSSLQDFDFDSPDIIQNVVLSKRRRIRGRELVELFNEATSSPLSDECSPILFNDFNHEQQKQEVRSYQRLEDDSSESFSETDISTVFDGSFAAADNSESDTEVIPLNKPDDQSSNTVKLPISFESLRSKFVSPPSLFPVVVDVRSPDQSSEMLFEDSDISVEKAIALTELFCSRFNLSDECSSTMITLIRNLLPRGNNFPSAYSYVNKIKT